MKNLIIILFLSCFSFAYSQSETPKTAKENTNKEDVINWISITEAIELNKSFPKKKIFIDFYTDWCGWCKRMDATTFSHPYIAKYMSEKFWCVKFDAERKDTVYIDNTAYVNPNPEGRRSAHQLAKNFLNNRMSYPSYVVMNEANNVISVIPGYYKPSDFESIIKYFGENQHFVMPYAQYQAEFEGEIKEDK